MAARSDHRPARHCFSLAPSRLLGNLGLMSPLPRRTPQDQWRGPRAYSPNEPREFLMGRATDPWRAAETWIRCLASHSVPLHAATGLSAHPEVAHLPAEPSICERCDRFRRSRSATRRRPRMDHASCRRATKVRDGIPCGFIERSSTLHPVPPYRSSNLTDWLPAALGRRASDAR